MLFSRTGLFLSIMSTTVARPLCLYNPGPPKYFGPAPKRLAAERFDQVALAILSGGRDCAVFHFVPEHYIYMLAIKIS